MNANTKVLGLAAAVALTAAAAHFSPAWTAKLAPVGGSNVTGSATVTATTPDSASASITIMGAKSGQYPWHVHSGKCGGEGSPVGNESAYPALSVQNGNQATASAVIGFKPVDGSPYSVNVHKSMTDKAVIACGDLSNGGMGTTGMGTTDTTLHPVTPDTTMKPAKP